MSRKNNNGIFELGSEKITDLLINNGANVNSRNVDGDTALNLAIAFGNFKIFQSLKVNTMQTSMGLFY